MRRFSFIFLLLFMLIMASACSGGNKAANTDLNPDQAAVEEPVSATPSAKPEGSADDTKSINYQTENVSERLLLEPGKFSGALYDEIEVKKIIGQFPEGLTAEEYYARLLALVAEDYRPYYEFFSRFDTSYEEASAHPEEREQPGGASGKQLNVQILFDASGSMAGKIGEEQRIVLAKEAVKSFAADLPETANVSLRVYGHQGSGKNSDRELSCRSTEEVYPLSPYQEESFTKALDRFAPVGWTPLGASIEAAYEDLQHHTGEHIENIVYIVSDGVETCGGDPVAAAKKLNQSEAKAIVNIIGFDVDDEGQQELKKVAEAGNGKYSTVRTKQEIDDFFKKEKSRLISEWFAWQSENVDQYFDSQNSRVDELFNTQNEMVDLASNEEQRLRELSNYVDDKFGVDGSDIRERARNMGYELREYARNTGFQLREELRNKGFELREEVRNQGFEERENLRNNSQ